ncbi:MAG: hypothetical protein MZV64_71435 [Ignavibacteriales bacterium]|nr:hypothetical protein [Ignavibacteriales bacterium]
MEIDPMSKYLVRLANYQAILSEVRSAPVRSPVLLTLEMKASGKYR